MEIIQDIGAYAGFAAVVGLAVLSALYFSQARDVKRLREWAGRAPERTTPPAARPAQPAQGQAQPQPQAQPAAGQQAAAAGARPGTAPGTAKPVPAEQKSGTVKPIPAPAAGGNAKGPAPQAPAPAKAGAPAPAKAGAPAAAASGAAPATARSGAPAGTEARPDGSGQGTADRPPVPGRPGGPGSKPVAPRPRTVRPPTSRQTQVIPGGTARQGLEAPEGRRVRPAYAVLLVAGVLIVGGAALFGASKLVEDDEEPATQQADAPAEEAPRAPERRSAPVNPSQVTVAVLNGTTVQGLAADVADKLQDDGFQRGNVANFTEQQRAESVVLYARGARPEARSVSRRLGISQTEAIDSESQDLAGNASVVVVVGADQTP
jgi:hypothetical protein